MGREKKGRIGMRRAQKKKPSHGKARVSAPAPAPEPEPEVELESEPEPESEPYPKPLSPILSSGRARVYPSEVRIKLEDLLDAVEGEVSGKRERQFQHRAWSLLHRDQRRSAG